MPRVDVIFPIKLLEDLDKYCKNLSSQRSEFIRDLIREKIYKKKPAQKPKCPLELSNQYPELCKSYPGGHKECVQYIESVAKDKKHKFINYPKQIACIHKALRAGFDFSDLDSAVDKIEKSSFYKDKGWDFATVGAVLDRE